MMQLEPAAYSVPKEHTALANPDTFALRQMLIISLLGVVSIAHFADFGGATQQIMCRRHRTRSWQLRDSLLLTAKITAMKMNVVHRQRLLRRSRGRMSIRNELVWMIGFGISSIVCAPEAPYANRRAEAGDPSSATALPHVGDRPAETAPAIPAKLLRYAQRLVKQYDRNGSGALEEKEWAAMPGDPRKVDRNRDGAITVEELVDYLARYSRSHPLQGERAAWQRLSRPPAAIFRPATPAEQSRENPAAGQAGALGRAEGEPSAENALSGDIELPDGKRATATPRAARKYYVGPKAIPPGLPDWFTERDADGDGQLTLSEFAPDGSAAQRQLFARYDLNGDGVITPEEVVRGLKTSPENGKKPTAAKQPAEKKTSASSAAKQDRASPP
jgi:hypothetical protein